MSPNDDDIKCPHCGSELLSHRWNADMIRLEVVDYWRCLKCTERWEVRTSLEEMRKA